MYQLLENLTIHVVYNTCIGNISPLVRAKLHHQKIYMYLQVHLHVQVIRKFGSWTFIDWKCYTMRIHIKLFLQRWNNGIQRTSLVPKSKMIVNIYQQHPNFWPPLISWKVTLINYQIDREVQFFFKFSSQWWFG